MKSMTDPLTPLKKTEDYLNSLLKRGLKYIPFTRCKQNIPSHLSQKPQENSKKDRLLALREKALKCTLCSELAHSRNSVVFGSGNADADLVFVGEAPGFDEDRQGLPFVGRAGQLLTKIIESIGLDRKQVFICNVLKCRPPENRNPVPEEIKNCQPYLKQQLEIIQPKVICCLGKFACKTLLATSTSISALRGKWHTYQGIALMPTFHPAYLLRNPADKRKVWEDMKQIRSKLNS
jgi:uracil-DNA glycosylase